MINKETKPYNDNNLPHGYWIGYHPNGKLWYKGNYINGSFNGFWVVYNNGSEVYKRLYYIL
jgi:antitoxin component YwqK of YwqJK toxin-antitoxin module